MTPEEAARCWDGNAAEWVRLVRAGYDESRDLVNTPAFLAMLPAVAGLRGLDVGCGEGHNTRLVARRGARMVALDVAAVMVAATAGAERARPLGVGAVRGTGLALPFADQVFDFAVAFMSVMDMPDHATVLREVHRVLRPGGFFQFSLSHPCFQTPLMEWVHDEAGRRRGVVCGDYFRELNGELEQWTFGAARRAGETPVPFRIPRFTHTLSTWVNLLAQAGFHVEQMCEPTVDAAVLAARPDLYDHTIIPFFLQLRVRRGPGPRSASPA